MAATAIAMLKRRGTGAEVRTASDALSANTTSVEPSRDTARNKT